MTTLGFVERYTFDGYDLADYATGVHAVDGVDDFPTLRGDSPPKSGLPGRTALGGLLDSREIQLSLYVSPWDPAGAVPADQRVGMRTNLDALYAILDPHRGQKLLTRRMPDATVRSASAQVRAVMEFPTKARQRLKFLVATFELADPYWYGATTTGPGSTATPASPTAFSFTNPGKVRAHRLLIDFTGPITNPRLTNLTTGAWVQFTGVVASTKHLLIDAYAFTATNDGANVEGLITQGSTVPFMDLAPGVNSMQVTASSPGGSVLVTAYPAFL